MKINILLALIAVCLTSSVFAQQAKSKAKSKTSARPAPVAAPVETSEEEAAVEESEPQRNVPDAYKPKENIQSFHIYGSPLYALLSQLRGGFDFGVGEKLTIGPALWYAGENSFYRSTDYKATFIAIGVRAMYSLTGKRFRDGVHISPFLKYTTIRVESRTGSSSAEANGYYFGGLLSYSWFWQSGLSFDLGAGYHVLTMGDIKVQVGGTTTNVSNATSYSGLALVANLGWAF